MKNVHSGKYKQKKPYTSWTHTASVIHKQDYVQTVTSTLNFQQLEM